MSERARNSIRWDRPLWPIVQPLAISTAIIIFFYAFVRWVLHEPSVDTSVKAVKLLSLISMNYFGGAANRVIARLYPATVRRIGGRYKIIRVYIWVVIGLLFLSLAFELNVVSDHLGEPWTPEVRRFSAFILARWYLIPDQYRIMILDALILLFPIGLYAWSNLASIRDQQVRQEVKEHLKNVFYFVTLPSLISLLAFFFIVLTLLHLTKIEEQILFAGGAFALLIFMSNAMTICVDGYAIATFYEAGDRDWVPNLRAPSIRVLALSSIVGAVSVCGFFFPLPIVSVGNFWIAIIGYLILAVGCYSSSTGHSSRKQRILQAPSRQMFVISFVLVVVACLGSLLPDPYPFIGANAIWLAAIGYALLIHECIKKR